MSQASACAIASAWEALSAPLRLVDSYSGLSAWHEDHLLREVAHLCPTLCDPMDCSSPGSSVHGIFQARVLEWDAIAFSEVCLRHVQIILGNATLKAAP